MGAAATPGRGAVLSGSGISWVGRRTGIPGLELMLEASRGAVADAGLAPADLAALYEGFGFVALAWLEPPSLCGEGESAPFVEGGTRIGLDGELRLSTTASVEETSAEETSVDREP